MVQLNRNNGQVDHGMGESLKLPMQDGTSSLLKICMSYSSSLGLSVHTIAEKIHMIDVVLDLGSYLKSFLLESQPLKYAYRLGRSVTVVPFVSC